ncbi:disco-interacting protein 2 homolog C-like isoform X2 [Poecilia formosa]|uniref:disco-interacting protein 2 homolog C-like isoform X2 n=1 Tax=Poecilia formosa TaxID=48698 RepID=UPI0007B93811|nr:PREDICTED: disco-interacting protein 2 homolog C-like isoform X2 [Poecilia formosa]
MNQRPPAGRGEGSVSAFCSRARCCCCCFRQHERFGEMKSTAGRQGGGGSAAAAPGDRGQLGSSSSCRSIEMQHDEEGDITQKGYEKKRSKLIGAYFPQTPGMDPSMGQERRTPVTPSSSSRYNRRRSSGSRDERYRSDVHTEAVQAALAKHKERKMAVPMPSKRRSLVVQTSMDAYTPPDTSSGSEGEGQGDEDVGDGEEEDGGGGGGTSSSREGSISMEHWISRAVHSSTTTTSSTASSSSSSTRSGGSGAAAGRLADVLAQHVHISAQHHLRHHRHHHRHKTENHSAPPDVTGCTNNTANTTADGIQVERGPPGGGGGSAAQRQTPKYGNAELMETGDGVPVSSRVSAKIQQLVNTLKRPKRPPLREFFVDDFEELLEVQQPDPNLPKAEGAQMAAMRGEQLGVVTNWPPSLEAALQRWGTISPKAPCLTTMDTNGKPLYVLTYGKLWSRSVKVAYNLLHKLGTKQEPLVRPGDRVSLKKRVWFAVKNVSTLASNRQNFANLKLCCHVVLVGGKSNTNQIFFYSMRFYLCHFYL